MTILEYTSQSTWHFFYELELMQCSDYNLIEEMIEKGMLRRRKGMNQQLSEVIR